MNNVFLSPSRKVHLLTRQGGASLLEGIAYLGIAALVILGAVSLLSGALSSAKNNKAAEEIVALRTAAIRLYMGQVGAYPTGVNAMTAPLAAANAIPATILNSAGALTNSWGGPITIQGVLAGTAFTIVYNNVPVEACISLLTGSRGWTSVAVTGAAEGARLGVISPAQATNDCSGAAANTITWTAS